ncbi:MAG TPA: cation:proton antiporter [Solirubrobacterales bacterium]|nr:cation:proton antiporter [Solirubrobacterales bacterium]
MIDVDTSSFFAIVTVAALAAITVAVLPSRFAPPVVVLELVLGIAIGPQVLHLAHSDDFIAFFSNLGLGMLFYFAGYEIDFARIEGKPLRLGAAGWALSVALAYGIGGALAAAGIVVSFLYTGSAMATTAIGTLIPILRDTGELKTRFGTYLLAAGACGEFGPVLLITGRERVSLAFYCATELPLVVAITTLAIDEGHMRHSTAAGLVGAAMLSTLIFPFVALALKKRADAESNGRGARRSGEAPALA